MGFDFSELGDLGDSGLVIREDIPAALRLEWERLASRGTWWSGEDRVAIAAEARRAMGGESAGEELPPELVVVIRKVAVDSPRIDGAWVDALDARGIALAPYVEVIGIVSRLSSVDYFHITLGLPLEPLPTPSPVAPTRVPPPDHVVVDKSFVPMVAPVSIPQTLSFVPEETTAWQELSDALYMTFRDMEDPDFSRALHRTQIELVAARTSEVNECFY